MAKKERIQVGESGSAPALQHNPFAALSGMRAKPAPDLADVQATLSTASAARLEPVGAQRTPSAGRLLLRRETKHRGGKSVVVVYGFGVGCTLEATGLAELAKHLKQQLACGGAVERRGDQHEIVLQADQPARIAELLRARGFEVGGVTS